MLQLQMLQLQMQECRRYLECAGVVAAFQEHDGAAAAAPCTAAVQLQMSLLLPSRHPHPPSALSESVINIGRRGYLECPRRAALKYHQHSNRQPLEDSINNDAPCPRPRPLHPRCIRH